jgi:hypothetical protein
MDNERLLTITSLFAIVLLSLHFTDDVVRGIEPGNMESMGGVAILAFWTWTTLVPARRRWSHAILFTGALFAALMPVLHLRGRGVGGAFAASDGAFLSIWLLFALGTLGVVSMALAARGFVRARAA